jgi:hypothetical protein
MIDASRVCLLKRSIVKVAEPWGSRNIEMSAEALRPYRYEGRGAQAIDDVECVSNQFSNSESTLV